MKTRPNNSAFTLIELLVVIAIIGILAAISAPTLKNFRAGDALAASTRQLLDDVARARQFAISQRTTVYMVFCPQGFWTDPNYASLYASLTPAEQKKISKLYDKQLIGYAFVSLKTIGDQPGQQSPRYLSRWNTMPEGAIIAPWKFSNLRSAYQRITDPPVGALPTDPYYDIYGFAVTNNIPFPSEDAYVPGKTYIWLPYIAFNHLGQIEPPAGEQFGGRDGRGSEYIPVARGSVTVTRSNGVPIQSVASVNESPANNSINAFSLVQIDALTGRAKLVKQEVR